MLKRNGKVANRDDQLSLLILYRLASEKSYLTQYGLMAESDFASFDGVLRGSRRCWLDSHFDPCATGAGHREIDVNNHTDLVLKERLNYE